MSTAILFSILDADGSTQVLELKGRDAWALGELIRVGDDGCTPIDTPGPRWSSYVHKLRRRGLDVQTVTETHDGPFKGTHARYILRTMVHRLSEPTAAIASRSGADAA